MLSELDRLGLSEMSRMLTEALDADVIKRAEEGLVTDGNTAIRFGNTFGIFKHGQLRHWADEMQRMSEANPSTS